MTVKKKLKILQICTRQNTFAAPCSLRFVQKEENPNVYHSLAIRKVQAYQIPSKNVFLIFSFNYLRTKLQNQFIVHTNRSL